MTDVALFQTNDGGEIEVVNGVFTMDDGPATAAYLSLWGGNEQDSGSDGDKPKQWWANTEQPDPAKQYRSELQYLLNTLPITAGNLKRFEDAGMRDLAWMIPAGIATSVSVFCRIPAVNRVEIRISGELNGKTFDLPTITWPPKVPTQ